MDEDPTAKRRFSIRGWEPRWGHIFMALFVIGLLVLTFVIVRRIKNETNNNCANSVMSTNSCQANNSKNKSSKSKSQTATTEGSKSKTSSKNKSTTTNKSPSGSKSNSSAASKSTSTPGTSKSTSPSQTATSPATSQALANTGPGDVISVFVATSALSAIGYNLYIRYKLANKSN